MVTMFVDGQPYQVKEGQNLLHACLSLGLNLPYFCWHPAMHSVGACRQCAVKQFRDEQDTRGRIVMACMTPVAEGIRISIDDPEARAFRASVIEWLMVNHPHDCPVCDEGGECHLQDMTVMTGHVYRRFRFKKRSYHNQYLGPLVNHEHNRCIQCYRCVRYYRDYAGGHDLNVFAAHDHVYFGRQEDGALENEFSGNLVEICPTGVFTDRTLKRHYTRKWDLQSTPSLCVHCGLGCNTLPGERYGILRRILNRYNSQVNGYFLCDRGRFGYEFVNSDLRIRHPSVRVGGQEVERGEREVVTREEGVRRLASLLESSSGVIGIGSPRASLEANFALRTLVGPDRFHLGSSEIDARLVSLLLEVSRTTPVSIPSLEEVRSSDAVLVLGEDVTNVAPSLALALRQSVRQEPLKIADGLRIPRWNDAAVRDALQQEKGPLFVATVGATKLDELSTESYRGAPADLARLGFAVARALSADAPAVADLPEGVDGLANRVARALRAAERPLVVSGASLGDEAIPRAAANVTLALRAEGRPAGLCIIVPECNSLGLGLLGGGSLEAAFEAVRRGRADTVVVLENDFYRRAKAAAVDAFLEAVPHLVVLDHLANGTTEKAELLLPAATFAESDGTLVNNEGRAQRFFQTFVSGHDVQESWRWLRDAMVAIGRLEAGAWHALDDVIAALVETLPALVPIAEVAPPADFRLAGERIPRQPQRYSGRTAMHADIDVSEPRPPDDPDSPLAFSMEGYDLPPPPALIPRFWAPGWNSQQAINKFQSEVGGPLRGGDPGLRLFEPTPDARPAFFQGVPQPHQPRAGQLLVVPLHHIFGSEELSIRAPGIAELAPRPYLGLGSRDLRELRLREGEEVELLLGGALRRLAVRLMPALPPGIAGLPAGLPDLLGIDLPTWIKLGSVE